VVGKKSPAQVFRVDMVWGSMLPRDPSSCPLVFVKGLVGRPIGSLSLSQTTDRTNGGCARGLGISSGARDFL